MRGVLTQRDAENKRGEPQGENAEGIKGKTLRDIEF